MKGKETEAGGEWEGEVLPGGVLGEQKGEMQGSRFLLYLSFFLIFVSEIGRPMQIRWARRVAAKEPARSGYSKSNFKELINI